MTEYAQKGPASNRQSSPDDVCFDLHAMWNIGVFKVLSKEEEETSKLLAFKYA